MAFMPFVVNRVGPYCTMKSMKSMKVKRDPGICRGLPCFDQSSLQETPIGNPLVSLERLVVKRSG